ncbi:hypothetical protein PVAND_007762 [Polypedilum vanderplanki]|uniref:Uncharacterized protein n=1 Tax=Polypedilum vanderplanki TaxID=319348 RepID=A0A9J6C8E4_POLVA|nr:hypothetical protein PVAND_007762 [Polypedilum vanderplanki]
MHPTTPIVDFLAMMTVFMLILLLMVCCTSWRRVKRDKNDLFYKPKIVNFNNRRRSKSPVYTDIFLVSVDEEKPKPQVNHQLKYLEYTTIKV